MSRTLFIYVFKQLFIVFGLTSAVIAGIMTFGGLLRPLTENGLELSQVGEMLAYAWPGMSTYSLPIAALFATTVVYGRLAADNEVTAIRAAGISLGPIGLGMPALVLGLLVSLISVTSLSFVVPAFTLKVERTVVSNIGQFVVNRIEQQHQVRLYQPGGQPPLTIYARSARLLDPDPASPNEQVVALQGVSIVTYARSERDKRIKEVPDEFYVAQEAWAYIRQPGLEEADEKPIIFKATLRNGMKFPRTLIGRADGAIQGGIRKLDFGPYELRSPLRENTKFMDIRRLKELLAKPEKSRRMSESLRELTRADQEAEYLRILRDQITQGIGVLKFRTLKGEDFTLQPGTRPPVLERNRLVLSGEPGAPESVKLIQTRRDSPSIESIAREAQLKVMADPELKQMSVTVQMIDSTVKGPDFESPRDSFEQDFGVPMPAEIAAISDRTVKAYIERTDLPQDASRALYRNLMKQDNSVLSEMHSRVSFAISCLVLTMVGYGLGVMFKSGNYLTAFAVSVMPALMSIVLIVTGQHICENVPPDITTSFKNPLEMGLIVIWTGNVIVLGMAVVLMVRLRRT